MDPLPYGTDQIIDLTMARALHADACRTMPWLHGRSCGPFRHMRAESAAKENQQNQ
jgi:hypothetical protein